MNTVRTSSALSDGLRLLVKEQGDPDRPTVLLVHGYPDNSTVWDGMADLLADRFHVVRFDVRGTGGSAAPPGRDGYRVDRLAADIAVVAELTSPGRPVHLVGHDWGSVEAWQAVTEPDYAPLFASYTSISGPCLDHVDAWMRRKVTRLRLWPVLRQLLHSWYIGFFQLPKLPEIAWRLPFLRARFGAEKRDAINGIELYRANMLVSRAGRPDRRTSVPVQQLALSKDIFVLPELLAAAEPWCVGLWRRSLPYAHWAPCTHPAAIAERVTEFIDHLAGAPAGRELRRARITAEPAPFAGRLVLVTGAGSGIGRSTALAFAAAGADVLAVDIDETGAAATAHRAREHGVDAHPYTVDVADTAAMNKLADQVRAEHGVPYIVMANAGIGVAGGFLDTDEDDWRRVVDVNLWGVVHTLRAFAPMLVDRGQGGHIVVTASMAAYCPWPELTAYATTKAAVLSLAQSLRTELAPHGIGVSAICPGMIATNIVNTTRFAGQDEATELRSRQATDAIYRRRHYGPDKVAKAVLRAVATNRAIVPVTPEAHIAAAGARLSPGLVRRLGGLVRARR
ncbi:MAG TPA: SDR family oxidoreductase [Pseudonocardiaceae bacterium]|nr:SDR family oxidoreductase [Pseudonocardiaceae bacterium]